MAFWEPDDFALRQSTGSLAVLADGVGGEGNGELASRLAVDAALTAFREARPGLPEQELLRLVFESAAARVFQAAPARERMATTLNAAIFRRDRVSVAHVGDSRSYLIRAGKIRRLTTDHSYTALQVKLGLLLERNAMTSPHRSTLTRSLGHEPVCHYDYCTELLLPGDLLLQCSDGLYGSLLDDEILDAAVKYHPGEACKRLVGLAEKRQASDNVSVQIIQVWEVEQSPDGRPSPLAGRSAGSDLGVGDVLDARFEITDLIARTAMAAMFKAVDRLSGAAVALKVPHLQIESDAAGFDRFKREEEIGLQLDHPNLLRIIRVQDKSRPYIAMEYLPGQTLGDLLRNVHPLPEPDAVRIASLVCGALAYLHGKGVVHRDLKPQNIMLCNDGSVRIMDFGIARSQGSRRLTFVGFTPAMGTPDYMAPEQVRGSRGDERTDIYSLGAILYEMCTGTPPFGGESAYVIMNARVTGDPVAPRKANPALTPVLEEVILHAMERDPRRRFPSAAAMKAELDDYERVELTDRYSRLQAPQAWGRYFPPLSWVIGFVLLQLVILVAMALYFRHR